VVDELRILHLPHELQRCGCVGLGSGGVSAREADDRTPLAHVRLQVVRRPGLALGKELVRVPHTVVPGPGEILDPDAYSAGEAHHCPDPEPGSQTQRLGAELRVATDVTLGERDEPEVVAEPRRLGRIAGESEFEGALQVGDALGVAGSGATKPDAAESGDPLFVE